MKDSRRLTRIGGPGVPGAGSLRLSLRVGRSSAGRLSAVLVAAGVALGAAGYARSRPAAAQDRWRDLESGGWRRDAGVAPARTGYRGRAAPPAVRPDAPAVAGLVLVDAVTGRELMPLGSGSVIDLSALPSRRLNVRAETTGRVSAVRFGYDDDDRYRVEYAHPYCLAGKRPGAYNQWTPRPGRHTIVATPYRRVGGVSEPGSSLRASFDVVEGSGSRAPGGSTHVASASAPAGDRRTRPGGPGPDAATERATGADAVLPADAGLPADAVLPADAGLPAGGGLAAGVAASPAVGGDAPGDDRVEGDSARASLRFGGPETPRFPGGDGGPPVPPPRDTAVVPDGLAVTGLFLVDAATGQDIAPLGSGVVDLAALPTRDLSLRAQVAGDPGKVVFDYDARRGVRVERARPYLIRGKQGGRIHPWTPKVGTHLVVVTPYERGAGGRDSDVKGSAASALFTVIDSSLSEPRPSGARSPRHRHGGAAARPRRGETPEAPDESRGISVEDQAAPPAGDVRDAPTPDPSYVPVFGPTPSDGPSRARAAAALPGTAARNPGPPDPDDAGALPAASRDAERAAEERLLRHRRTVRRLERVEARRRRAGDRDRPTETAAPAPDENGSEAPEEWRDL